MGVQVPRLLLSSTHSVLLSCSHGTEEKNQDV